MTGRETPAQGAKSGNAAVRSLGVEFPVVDDPTKLHGIVTADGDSLWRCECMACGLRTTLVNSPRAARAVCVRHANSAGHLARLYAVRRADR